MAIVPLLTRDKDCPPGMSPLTIDTVTGAKVYYEDLDGDKVRLVRIAPVQAVLDQNAAERYDAKGTFTRKGKWGFKAASIPTQMLEDWKRHDDGSLLDPDDFEVKLKRKLNSNENFKLRIGEANL